MSRSTPPEIDPRTTTQLFGRLRAMVPHYTREWPAKDDNDPGVGLLQIFSFLADGVIQRLNRAPERNFLCFLEMLGIRLLPETPASVPVRFLVATGATEPILVRKGTQVSAAATAQHPELPFETTKDLQAIPAALSALFAVDPSKDVILKPPPGFLGLQTESATQPPYQIAAFSSAGSNSFQLSLVDQLQKDDFLRIQTELSGASASRCCSTAETASTIAADHLSVSDIKGNIVLVIEPLPRDYTEGVLVERVTRFDLLNGKNSQEHVLYLAHGDLFNVKSEAVFTLVFVHSGGGGSNLQPLRIAWEFFGVVDPSKEEGWHLLTVDSDGTSGFSTGGQIQLSKPAGEIKEKEINGNKNRWIRARLTDPIPATPASSVPKIESVALRVSSAGNGLPADLAFHNDTPQPVNLAFHPFGVEPRIFDRFYLASKEAFSKPGAEIDIELDLDVTDLLASPAAVLDQELFRVFAHGATGRLIEFQIDATGAKAHKIEKNHIGPPNTRITAGTIPAPVLSADGSRLGVFVRTDNQRIYLRFLIGTDPAAWQWIDLGSPKDVSPAFNPVAIREGTAWRVFTVAGDRVYSRSVDPTNPNANQGDPLQWTILGGNETIASTPFVIDSTLVFATDDSGRLLRHDGSKWNALGQGAATNSRPCAILSPSGTEAEVFCRDPQGQLLYFNTGGIAPILPRPGSPLVSDPSVVETADGSIRVYARGEDKRLWSIDPDSNPAWVSTIAPLEMNLAGDPFAIFSEVGPANQKSIVLSVFSTSDKNALLELRDAFEIHSGQLQAGPLDVCLLENDLDLSGDPIYIHMLGTGDVRRIVHKIQPNATSSVVAILERPLTALAASGTQYELLKQMAAGQLQGVALDTATLQSTSGIPPGDHVLVGDQLRKILNFVGNVATLTTSWTSQPAINSPYVVLQVLPGPEIAQPDADKHLVLAASASGDYQGLSITIPPSGAASEIRTIANYTAAEKLAQVSTAFSSPPAKDAFYEVAKVNPTVAWLQYRDPDQTELRPELSWEYWNGTGWVALGVTDTTSKFLVSGHVTFELPHDIVNTEVAGQDNFWIRARIVGGDYGRELFFVDPITNKLEIKKDPIRPPLIKRLRIKYSFSQDLFPQACLTLNNLSYLDQTAANITPDKFFLPFAPLPDVEPTIYFGFDKGFQGGPIRLYAAAKELPVDERNKPKFEWTFEADNRWKTVLAEDETNAFTRPGIITWTIPGEFQKRERFGEALHWVRASLVEGVWTEAPVLSGLFLNTVRALQARTILDEILGSSDGTAGQIFRFAQLPVLKQEEIGVKEEIRVREVLTDEERDGLIAAEGKDAVFEIRDLEGRVLESWVRWREVIELFNSTGESRDYRLDRASGELQFGDGKHGKIPPVGGDNIRAFSYQAGGGAAGNVRAGQINSLVTSVGGIDSVINPVDAGGGSERATPEQMLEIGPAQISNRGRAVTPEDFEWLAKEASREVRKARCIASRNPQGRRESGWVSVYIVPDSTEPLPMPSLELRRSVTRYLARRADLNIVGQEHIFVAAPEYVRVGVEVTVFARSLDDTAVAELNVRKKLDTFLHPLTGGPGGTGWEFGRELAASDIYLLLEEIDEVDHVGEILLRFNGQESAMRTETDPNALVAGGEHLITISVANGG